MLACREIAEHGESEPSENWAVLVSLPAAVSTSCSDKNSPMSPKTYKQIAWGWENLGLFWHGTFILGLVEKSIPTKPIHSIFLGLFLGLSIDISLDSSKHSQAMENQKPLWIPDYWVNLSSEQFINTLSYKHIYVHVCISYIHHFIWYKWDYLY